MTKLGSDIFSEVTDVDSIITNNTNRITALEDQSAALLIIIPHVTLAAAQLDTTLELGDVVQLAAHTAGQGGGALWDVVDITTITINAINFVTLAVGTLALVLRLTGVNAKDPRAWGIFGTNAGNDAAYQAALDSNVGHIHFKVASVPYKFLTSHDCTVVDKSVTGEKGVVIDCTDPAFSGNHFTRFLGTLTQISDLSGDVDFADSILNSVDATGINRNDVIVIWNPTTFSFSGFRSNYHAGEMVEVQSVSVNAVTIQSSLYAGYLAAAVNVYKLESPKFSFGGGLTINGDKSNDLIVFELCKNSYVGGYEANHKNNTCLRVSRCFNVNGDNLKFYNEGDGGDDYGLSIGNSQNCNFIEIDIFSRRHPVTMGGGSNDGSVPVRNVKISHSTLRNDTQAGLHSADFHGNCEDCSYEYCKIYGGITWQGKNNGYKHCNIFSGSNGVLLQAAEILGGTHYMDDCTCWINGRAQDVTRGSIDLGGNSTVISADTIEDCTFRISGGAYTLINAGAGSRLITMVNRGTDVAVNFSIKPDEINGDVLLAVLRTELVSGTENSDFIEIGTIKGTLPRPIQLRSNPSNAYLNTPHKLPKSSGLATVTTATNEKTTIAPAFVFPYIYPRTPHFTVARGNRAAIGSFYGFAAATVVSTTGITVALRNEDSINWSSVQTVDLSYIVGIDEL